MRRTKKAKWALLDFPFYALVSFYGNAIIKNIIKLEQLKNKRTLFIVLAVLFIALLFFLKQKSSYQNAVGDKVGLAYGEVKVGDLVTQDTDKDGIPDWEENLWGTDPNKKDTDGDGINDDIAIAKIKAQNGATVSSADKEENLTETDKFSRELFSTVATLNQAGPVDKNTVDKISASLSEKIKNPVVRKTYLLSEIKTTEDNSPQAYQKYINQISDIYKKYQTKGSVIEILAEFTKDPENPNADALSKLDPIIKQSSLVILALTKMEVPTEIGQLHISLINSLEKLQENISDLQMFDTDTIVAMSAMSKYEENVNFLEATKQKLGDAIRAKIKN